MAVGKHLLVEGVNELVSHLPANVSCFFPGIRCCDNLPTGMSAQIPGWKVLADQHGFPMPRRSRDNKPVDFTPLYRFQVIGNQPVVHPHLILGVLQRTITEQFAVGQVCRVQALLFRWFLPCLFYLLFDTLYQWLRCHFRRFGHPCLFRLRFSELAEACPYRPWSPVRGP